MRWRRRQNLPLRLHWWKARPNFGDAVSPLIVAHVSGRVVEHAAPETADMFALGSLLQVVRRACVTARARGRPVIWGSGMLAPPAGRKFLENIDVALLRGPVSAAILNIAADRFGDPGLLINEVLPHSGARADRIGIVPHHTLVDDPALAALVASDPAYLLIDPAGDPVTVCATIAGCAHVVASSLHGLITADAYGVANTWLEPRGQGRLKFLDYAAAVGRVMAAPITLADVPRAVRAAATGPLPYQGGIDACRAALHASFPRDLRARSAG